MTRHNLKETLKALAAVLNHLIGETVRKYFSW